MIIEWRTDTGTYHPVVEVGVARHEFRPGPRGYARGAWVRGLPRRRSCQPASAARPCRRRVRREPSAGLRRRDGGGGGDRVVRGEGGVLRHCARAVEKLPSSQDKAGQGKKQQKTRAGGGSGKERHGRTDGSEKQKRLAGCLAWGFWLCGGVLYIDVAGRVFVVFW